MLEEHIVLVCGTSNTTEDIALHEVVDVGPKPIDNLYSTVVLRVRPSTVSGMLLHLALGGVQLTSWSSQMLI